jgi:hypothetical protein
VTGTILRTGAAAGVTAGILSGVPSTALSLATGRDPLEASEAAGTILLRAETRRVYLLLAAVPVHATISLGWSMLLAIALPQRRTVMWGAFAGLAIAALDLGPLARPFPRIKALPVGPQIADHVAFGILAAAVIERARTREEREGAAGP